MATRHQDDDYFLCPHCGAEVKIGAIFCRECGASDDSGWGQDDDVLLDTETAVDDEFDYHEFVRREFPGAGDEPIDPGRLKQLGIAIVILLICLALFLATVM